MAPSEKCPRPGTSTRCFDVHARGRSRPGDLDANVSALVRGSQLPFSLFEWVRGPQTGTLAA